MTLADLKEYIYDLVLQGMNGGQILWSDQYTGNPGPPVTTLKLKDSGVALFPINKVVNGQQRSYYEATKILEINRYTAGTPVHGTGGNILSGHENTAVDELTHFLLFLQSEDVADSNLQKNVCIMQMGPVRDLTALGKSLMYDYRAMQEYTVSFVLEYHPGAEPEVNT